MPESTEQDIPKENATRWQEAWEDWDKNNNERFWRKVHPNISSQETAPERTENIEILRIRQSKKGAHP